MNSIVRILLQAPDETSVQLRIDRHHKALVFVVANGWLSVQHAMPLRELDDALGDLLEVALESRVATLEVELTRKAGM